MLQTQNTNARQRWIDGLALGVVYVIWGTTYLAIRVGVRDIPPLILAGGRYVVAGAILYPLALRTTRKESSSGEEAGNRRIATWLTSAIIGFMLLAVGNGGVSVGETKLPSGLAAVLVATVPLWMILFARTILDQRVTLGKILGLMVGIAGVLTLVSSTTFSGHVVDVLIVLGASASWGLGSVLGHRLTLPRNVALATAMQMLCGGAMLLIVALLSGEFSKLHVSAISSSAWWAFVYLIGPGSILGFTAYQYALSHLPVSVVSTYAFVNPVVAVAAGALILNERFTFREGVGASVVLAAVVFIEFQTRKKSSTGRTTPEISASTQSVAVDEDRAL